MPVNSLKITRQWIEKDCHGKWDLAETILSREKLLQHTTKALSWELQSLLEMTPDEFPAASFYKWVQRYRKKYAVSPSSPDDKENKYRETVIKRTADKRKKNRGTKEGRGTGDGKTESGKTKNNDGWKNFQLTDPATLQRAESEPLLVKVIPNKKV